MSPIFWTAIFVILTLTSSNYIPGTSGRRKRDKEPVFDKYDLKLIGCDVCRFVVEQVREATEEKRAEAPIVSVAVRPGKKERRSSFSEDEVQEILGDVCHRKKKVGAWLWRTDLVEHTAKSTKHNQSFVYRPITKSEKKNGGSYLLIEHHPDYYGVWDREKATVQRSCERLFEDMDVDELSVALWKGELDEAALVSLTCEELSNSCGKKNRPKLMLERDDIAFEVTDAQLVETEQMMQSMEDSGMPPMVMQSRGDMEDELREMSEELGMSEEEMNEYMDSAKDMSAGGGAQENDEF